MESEEKSKKVKPWIIKLVVVLIVVVAAVTILHRSGVFSTESNITKLGFEDIGELATQVAYVTEVNVSEANRDLLGITIPFTHTKLIYSYGVEIKAGYDFAEISVEEDPEAKTIDLYLPKARILSTELDMDSFKVYHEKESIFRPISLEENNEALKTIEVNAKENAIANGLLEMARKNAELLLKGFIGNTYDLSTYQIRFNEKA